MDIVFFVVLIFVVLFGCVVFVGAPYVPSQKRRVEKAFVHLYPLKRRDVLVDIGSGDGVVLRVAAKKAGKVVGYEINILLVLLSRLLSVRQRRVRIRFANFWSVPLPDDTTVVYMFGVERDNRRLASKLQQESDRLHKRLMLITHGNPLVDITPVKTYEAYYLYAFNPLQPQKAQV